jgi:malonate decarboxylase gamma subunit
MSRSQTWFDALSTQTLPSPYRSIAIADSDLGSGTPARLLAVVPDPDNEFPRAR